MDEDPRLKFEACDRCAGNGEVVTDWDRYLHAQTGDKGDEAVAECPDCHGYGVSDRRLDWDQGGR